MRAKSAQAWEWRISDWRASLSTQLFHPLSFHKIVPGSTAQSSQISYEGEEEGDRKPRSILKQQTDQVLARNTARHSQPTALLPKVTWNSWNELLIS